MSVKYDLPSTFAATTKPWTFDSPFSQHPVDNALQGSLTNGVLVNMFKAPSFNDGSGAPEPTQHVYDSRLQQPPSSMNSKVAILNKTSPTTQDTKAQPAAAATATAAAATATAATATASTSTAVQPSATTTTTSAATAATKAEGFKGISGLVDSHLVAEAFTSEQSLNIIVIILSIIAICVCGVVFGFIIPSSAKADTKLSGGDVF